MVASPAAAAPQQRTSAARARRRVPTSLLLTAALSLGASACATDQPPPTAPPTERATPSPTVVAAPSPAAPPPALPEIPVASSRLVDQPVPSAVTPVDLTIPALDVQLPIDPVGVEPDGQMEIPPMAERGGWYRFGAAPGDESGTAVIAAHVDSVASAGLGPFARLTDLAPGAEVTVVDDSGTVHRYVVTDVSRQPKPEVLWQDVFTRDGEHRLVLITCGGTFRPEVRSYSDNVIVTAVPSDG